MKRIFALVLTLALAAPAPALAGGQGRRTLAPPGNSGVSQYLETVPTDAGQAPPGTGSPSGGLPRSGQHALSHLGSAGRLLSAVVAATAPPAPLTRPSGTGSAGIERSRRRAAAARRSPAPQSSAPPLNGAGHGSSPIAAVLSASTGAGGGLGWLVPLIVVSAVCAAVLGVLRRRAVQD